ncbi:Mimecan Osteoglycin [Triplophysa tibetana]|uniref:Mimecan n=1 Tax=Triplophysa tibetana TaxID=1572043 RepID=A0A5A9NEZ3_9TELE|nr:Mimecan Osteoglycin [Triplophysa tibetana]
MSNLRILLFFFTVPWMFCGTARNDKLVPRTRGILKIIDHEELISETSTFMEQRKPKKKVVPTPDYESLDSTVDQPKAESPAADNKDNKELPTCLTCVCLTGSVYCEDVFPDMTTVPPLPKETTYLYARFNKITKITGKDFGDIVTLRRIDLSGNLISEIEDGAFSKLTQLEELSLAENKLVKLPMLPAKLMSLNVNHNQLKTKGVKANAFKKLSKLAYLYLGDNELEAVPTLPESLRVVHLHNNNITTITDETFCKGNNTHYIRYNMLEVRFDGNPLMLAQYPNSFICLRSLPIGHYK